MDSSLDRRDFLRSSSAVGAAAAFGPFLSACAGRLAPLNDAEIREMSAAQAGAAIRDGRVSAEAHVQTLIARAEQLRDLNSLITLNKAGALAAARKIDAARSAGTPLPPLAGLAIVVKDNINFKELPTS